jgi:hypothetical protein
VERRSGVTQKHLKVLITVITVLVLDGSAFSSTKTLSPASLVPKEQRVVSPEPLPIRVALASPPSSSSGDAVQEINLAINNEPLSDVLQRIAEETNISFRGTSALLAQRISARIHASNWEEGVKQLLKDMDQISVWDENSELSHVIILGGKSFVSKPENAIASASGRQASFRRARRVNRENQAFPGPVVGASNRGKPSESSLRKLLRIQPGTELPQELFNDPGLNQFLKDNRITSPKDWKKFHKARTARKSVRRELRQILAEN